MAVHTFTLEFLGQLQNMSQLYFYAPLFLLSQHLSGVAMVYRSTITHRFYLQRNWGTWGYFHAAAEGKSTSLHITNILCDTAICTLISHSFLACLTVWQHVGAPTAAGGPGYRLFAVQGCVPCFGAITYLARPLDSTLCHLPLRGLAEVSVASPLSLPFFICQIKELLLLLCSGQPTPMAQE